MNVKVTSYAFSKGNVVLYPIQVNFFIETYHNCKLFKTDLNAYHYGDIGLPTIHLADTFKDSALTLQALNRFQPQR